MLRASLPMDHPGETQRQNDPAETENQEKGKFRMESSTRRRLTN